MSGAFAVSSSMHETSIQAQHAYAVQQLQQAGFGADEAVREARLLLEIATGMERTQQLMQPDRVLSEVQIAAFDALVARRAESEPMAYLSGEKEFYGRAFATSPATLIPRPDSEALVEAALALLPQDFAGRMLDLGTGTGCLLLTLLAERAQMQGIGVDKTMEATALAMHNADRLGLAAKSEFYTGSWFDALPETLAAFDLIISNPPYISTAEMGALMPDVRDYEPASALHGGEDGLDEYRRIVAQAEDWLTPGGMLVFEVGYQQAADVAALGQAQGLLHRRTVNDMAGHARVVVLQRSGGHAVFE
jgi:release factor glutamine methyltransferase